MANCPRVGCVHLRIARIFLLQIGRANIHQWPHLHHGHPFAIARGKILFGIPVVLGQKIVHSAATDLWHNPTADDQRRSTTHRTDLHHAGIETGMRTGDFHHALVQLDGHPPFGHDIGIASCQVLIRFFRTLELQYIHRLRYVTNCG